VVVVVVVEKDEYHEQKYSGCPAERGKRCKNKRGGTRRCV